VVLLIITLVGIYHFHVAFLASRKALKDKYGPTIYNSLTSTEQGRLNSTQWKWEGGLNSDVQRGSYSRSELWDNRAEWKRLGSGFEGETFIYGNTVVKTYKTGNAPFRNCVPGSQDGLRWPTEIQASVVLGDLSDPDTLRSDNAFIPVVDYFLAAGAVGHGAKWHLVTPYLPSGNLEKLARQLRESEETYTARDIDVLFRPSLEKVLGGLSTMHEKHGLCHDDIKFDNILTAPTDISATYNPDPEVKTHWMLADMGNVREVNHRYHSSVLWSVLNNNLPDCRSNDVFRLIKTYMRFLRSSVDDVAAFDTQFLAGNESWSQLFWAMHDEVVAGRPLDASQTRLQSRKRIPATNKPVDTARPNPGSAVSPSPLNRAFVGRDGARAKIVLDMTKVSAGEKLARNWGFSWLLGVPVTECRAM
jgi:serine/threonine protein kinase